MPDHERPMGTVVSSARYSPLPAAVAEILSRVSTATLSGQLRARGINNAFIEDVAPVRSDLRMVGYAYTLRYGALREDLQTTLGGPLNAQRRAIEDIGPGEVLVIEARGELGAGTLGDVLAARIHKRGAAGVVTDGALRDGAAFEHLDLPVYCGGRHAAVLGRRHIPLDTGLPVTCGRVLVIPGDVLVGDADGVIVLPRDLAEAVARDTAEQEQQERFILAQVHAGSSLPGLFPLGAEWRVKYEAWLAQQDPARSQRKAP